jgi:hypothetical protein
LIYTYQNLGVIVMTSSVDRTAPHVSVKTHLEATAWRFESQQLSTQGQLIDLAQILPEMLPFPFSGVIAFQSGDGFIVLSLSQSG